MVAGLAVVPAAQAQAPASRGGTDPAAATTAAELVTEADARFQLRAVRVGAAPVVDGLLDDPAWQEASPIGGFVQSQPNEGEAATERTEVRVVYDGSTIFVGAILHDRNPGAIIAAGLRRDEQLDADDHLVVTFDTYHDHRNGYFFQTNANGAKFDAQIIGEGGASRFGGGTTFNESWDTVWHAAARIAPAGWVAEMAIPLRSLRFDPERMGVWGLNIRRGIPRRSELDYWAPVPRQYDATRLSQSGVLLGLERVASQRNLQVKPFVVGDVATAPVASGPAGLPTRHDTDASGDLGLDAKWAFTPNMTLDLTVNTDFSQVEADDVQINLTRFPLFFPEKREFFLENGGLFHFGSGEFGQRRMMGVGVLGFHSRRIGIFDGEQVPLLGGARVTGKLDSWSIGALTMQSGDTDVLDSSNYGVVRVRHELGDRSNVGMLFTNRQTSGDDYNRALGVDGRWAIGPETTVDAWWMTTESPGSDAASWAGEVKFEYGTPSLQLDGSVLEIGEGFDPELGFVNRTGLRNFSGTALWSPYPKAEWVRNLAPHVSFSYLTDRDGRLLTRFLHIDYDMFLHRGDKLSVAHNRRFEQLDQPFEIVPGVVIAPGAYHFDEVNFEAESDPSRPVKASLRYTFGGFYGGDRKNLELGAGLRVGSRFAVELSWSRNDITLPVDRFATDLVQARVAYDFNTRVFLAGLFQYDNQTDRVLSNVRLNFIHTPGADVFLVYNERRTWEDAGLIDRALILKVTHLLRF